MPTPESESFKAVKPTVPPTFDGVDYDDNKQLKAAQDAIIREQWVQSMMARLIREEMGRCYRREGVNHLEKCGHLRGTPDFTLQTRILRCNMHFAKNDILTVNIDRYLEQLKRAKIRGYLFNQQNFYAPPDQKQEISKNRGGDGSEVSDR